MFYTHILHFVESSFRDNTFHFALSIRLTLCINQKKLRAEYL